MRYAPWALWVLLPLTMFFRINLSTSEPVGLYRLTDGTPTRGTFVLLYSPIKSIAGVSGDVVRTAPEGSYINGRLWPTSAPQADFPHCPYGTYKLGRDQFWIMGRNPLSYDSRYFCAIPRTLISSTAEPVLTRTFP